MATRLHPSVYKGINRAVTRSFDAWSKRTYGMSGKRLLAKVAAVEGGGTAKRPNISSAGARGPFQFIPSTRAAYKAKYGLDAWRTNTEAARAAMIHLRGTGIRGYNPGLPAYEGMVLNAAVDTGPLKTGRYGSKGLAGAVRAGGGGGGGSPLRASAPTVQRDIVGPGGQGLVPLLKELRKQEQQPIVGAVPLAAPQFSAQAALPKGFQALESGPPPPEKTPIGDLLDLVQPGGGVPKGVVTPGSVSGGGGGGGGAVGGGGGKVRGRGANPMVKIRPGADRAGVPTSKHVKTLLERASSWGGLPIEVGTGSNHSKMTVSGNVSNHWNGWATDITNVGGINGKQGDRIAGALLVQLGVPRKKARQMAQRGGAYTVTRHGRRWQLIWKTPAGSAYGNHTDHVHIGFTPL